MCVLTFSLYTLSIFTIFSVEDESGEHKDVTWGIDRLVIQFAIYHLVVIIWFCFRVDQRELPLDKVYRVKKQIVQFYTCLGLQME